MAGIAGALAISAATSLVTAGLTYALTPTQKLQVGRQNDLTSGTTGYGAPLPWAWGTVRLSGQRIWLDYKEEVSKKSKQGKGTKVETEEFSYYGYWASAFCECPFRPISAYQRLWMNKKLVYSTIGGAETIAEGGKFADRYLRFYLGSPAQDIDPLLQNTTPISNYNYGLPADQVARDNYLASIGIDPNSVILTPAYNYRAYMVAQRLPLNDFNGALPYTDEGEIVASENCTVAQIVGDIFSLFFDEGRYDTSLLTTPVDGFNIDSIDAAKNTIQTLQQAYFFDIVDSNGVFKFIPLNHERDVINLRIEDLAAHISGTEKPLDYEIVENDPATLPSEITVKYIDPDLNYDVNEQRSQLDVAHYYNSNPTNLTFNLVLAASDAATIADRALALAWIQRYTYKFKLPPAYLYLEPGDLIPNHFDDGNYSIKITQIRIGANLILECEGVAHDNYFWDFSRNLEEVTLTTGIADYNIAIATSGTVNTVSNGNTTYTQGTDYTINNDGDVQVLSGGNIPEGTKLTITTTTQPTQSSTDTGQIVSAGNTELLVLDIPLIDNDDPDFTIYTAAGGGANWNGAAIYFSTDNSRYIYSTTIESYSIYGTCSSDLSGGKITVTLNRAELESITNSDLALGFNLALIGDKICQFKTAQLIDINTYELSDITTGLRGTETQPIPLSGDRFILLTGENAVIETIQGNASDIGQIRYFKAVSNGQTLDEVTPVSLTIQGIAQRPYAPVNLDATKNGVGDITITWDRRDRHSDIENPPILSEDVEEYLIEILNGVSPVRTINTNTRSYIYQAVDQTADFGSIQSSITVRVAQVSSSYGAGSSNSAILTPPLVEPVPTITGFNPASGLVGATITVTGTDLAQVSEVKIGDIIQDNLAVIDNQNITFNISTGTVSGLIEVTTTGGTAVSNNALIIETPPQALVFPVYELVTLPYTITPNDAGKELTISAQTATLSIPDSDTGFAAGWGCWLSLDGAGTVTIERESGGTSGILGNNAVGTDETVKLWHRGSNVWKID